MEQIAFDPQAVGEIGSSAGVSARSAADTSAEAAASPTAAVSATRRRRAD
jgi:hypothetical protein